jgi:hypothetical protein
VATRSEGVGLKTRGLARRRVHAAIAVAALMVVACGSTRAPAQSPPALAVSIQSPEGPAGVAVHDGTMQLYLTDSDGLHMVTSSPYAASRAPTVYLYSLGGTTDRAVNTFVFGVAPTGAAAVLIEPGDVHGTVANGVYLAGVPQKDVVPRDVTWSFLDSIGRVISQGTDIKS